MKKAYNPYQYEPIGVNTLDSIQHSYFQLNAPFAITGEYVHLDHNSLDYILAAPYYYSHEIFHSGEAVDPGLVSGLHQHDAVEIMFVLEGYIKHQIEDQHFTCSAGECYIMNKWIRHIEEYSTDYRAIFLMISDELISFLNDFNKMFNTLGNDKSPSGNIIYQLLKLTSDTDYKKCYIHLLPKTYTPETQENFEALFKKIMQQCQHSNISSNMIIAGYILQFFTLLGNPAFYNRQTLFLDTDPGENLFRQIIQILETCHGNIGRSELEERLHYSGDYINRIVKMNTGKSLIEYRNQYSMELAAQMILEETLSIAEIMQLLGFSNKTYFYKQFKDNYHMTPMEYLSSHQTTREHKKKL